MIQLSAVCRYVEAFQLFAQLMESDCSYKGATYVTLKPSLLKAIQVLIETQANVLDRMAQFAERYKENARIDTLIIKLFNLLPTESV